jgi:hypothetical protein
MMKESLPVLNYNRYEETAFDIVPILEGIVNDVVVFGVLSLQRAEGIKEIPDPKKAYNGLGKEVAAVVNSTTGTCVTGTVLVVPFEVAFQRRVLLDRGPATAVMVGGKHPAIPVQKPKPVPLPPVPEPKPAPVVPQSPITMTELLLQIAAMQTDFDLRLQVMAKRLALLEAK